MQATSGLAVDITTHTKTWGKPFGDTECFGEGIAWVSLWVSLLACRRPREDIISMAARTMKYHIAFQALARKHTWTSCISRNCKVSLLVVHYIAFHGLEPLSRQKSAHMKNSSSTLLPVSRILIGRGWNWIAILRKKCSSLGLFHPAGWAMSLCVCVW